MTSDSTILGLPYRNRRYRVWWRGFSGRVHRYAHPVCWDGECWYFVRRGQGRVILCPAIQRAVEEWKFAK